MKKVIKILFFALIIKPMVFIILGVNVKNKEKLPLNGPAIIAANHNSHLDALVLMSLYSLRDLPKIRPVAAADYFLSNRLLAALSSYCIDIIAFDRSGHANKEQLFADCHAALNQGDILILFPEGSRGAPEKIGKIKKGLFYLSKDRSDTPIIPVLLHGLGRSLPRGEALFVPFNCDVVVGDALDAVENSTAFIEHISARFNALFADCLTHPKQTDDSPLI